MNTPAHLLLGTAAFGRGHGRKVMIAALIGSLLPDLSLYLMAGISLSVLNIPASEVFGELYYSAAWKQVFAIDNSFLIWGTLLAAAIWARRRWAIALTAAALLHLALDFPLHHDDGRPHFWPISWWEFESPLSYWDTRHGAGWIGPLGLLASLASAVLIIRTRPGTALTILTVALMIAEIRVVIGWFQFVAGS